MKVNLPRSDMHHFNNLCFPQHFNLSIWEIQLKINLLESKIYSPRTSVKILTVKTWWRVLSLTCAFLGMKTRMHSCRTPVGCIPTVVVVGNRWQYEGVGQTPLWRQTPLFRQTDRRFWKHYLPLRSVIIMWCQSLFNICHVNCRKPMKKPNFAMKES